MTTLPETPQEAALRRALERRATAARLVKKADRDIAAAVLRDHGAPLGMGEELPGDEYDCCVDDLILKAGWLPEREVSTKYSVKLQFTKAEFEALTDVFFPLVSPRDGASKKLQAVGDKLWDAWADLHPRRGPFSVMNTAPTNRK